MYICVFCCGQCSSKGRARRAACAKHASSALALNLSLGPCHCNSLTMFCFGEKEGGGSQRVHVFRFRCCRSVQLLNLLAAVAGSSPFARELSRSARRGGRGGLQVVIGCVVATTCDQCDDSLHLVFLPRLDVTANCRTLLRYKEGSTSQRNFAQFPSAMLSQGWRFASLPAARIRELERYRNSTVRSERKWESFCAPMPRSGSNIAVLCGAEVLALPGTAWQPGRCEDGGCDTGHDSSCQCIYV